MHRTIIKVKAFPIRKIMVRLLTAIDVMKAVMYFLITKIRGNHGSQDD